jgi:hypothetical protein
MYQKQLVVAKGAEIGNLPNKVILINCFYKFYCDRRTVSSLTHQTSENFGHYILCLKSRLHPVKCCLQVKWDDFTWGRGSRFVWEKNH